MIGSSLIWGGCEKKDATPPGPLVEAAGIEAWFEDVTGNTGLDFVHLTGEGSRYFMPDQMGSGVALVDFDGDGRLDIFLLQNAGPNTETVHQLWRQEVDGRFRRVTEGSGLDVSGHGMGVAAGDVNNDGRVDLLVTEYGGLRLFLNQGQGHFLDITRAAGLDNPRWGTSAAFFDFNRDGWLDLVVANYLDYNPTQKCRDAAGRPEFCGPHGFPGLASKLFKNTGGGRFEDVTVSSGLARAPGPALGVMCADFDGDHWPDIFLADDGRPNRLFINRRNETFVEEAVGRGVALNSMGQTAGDMGVALGDVDGDGLFDLFITHLAEERHSLWIQEPRGLFQDQAGSRGLNLQEWRGTGFGTAFADFDHDGDLDLVFVNGRVKRGAGCPDVDGRLNPFWAPYAQRHQLFRNQGAGRFQDISSSNPALSGRASAGRGLACGDLNEDGALDLVITGVGGPATVLYNKAPRRGHWLMVRLVDPALGGRDAYGAEVIVTAAGRRWWRLVQPGSSYLSSHDPRVHLGLGDRVAFDSIEVLWPDGLAERFDGGPSDRSIILRRGEGIEVAER